jgi:hypothetical protein
MLNAALLLLLTRAVAAGQVPTFSTESDLVVLHVNIKDPRGAYVSGLAQGAFAILEDGRPQTIRFFALGRGNHERKILVVVSDRGDNASRTRFDEVIRKTQASNAVIYTVALVDPLEGDANPKLLKRIARASGGKAFAPRDIREITEVLRHIARDIRQTYTIGYVSTNSARDGAFRLVRVIVDAPNRRRLVVRTRAGYLSGAPKARGEGEAR